MVGERPIVDAEATQADRADAGLSAFPVEVDAPFEWGPAGAGAASVRDAHVGQTNALDLV
jgi:hypothetical protein